MKFFLDNRQKWILALLVLVAVYFGYSKQSSTENKQADQQKETASSDFDKKVENFIMNHPEVIMKSLEQMHVKKAADEQKKIAELIKSKKEELRDTTVSPFIGKKDSSNIVIAFIDYNCDYCRKLNIILNSLVEKNNDVKIILKQLPIINEASFYMAKAAIAVYNLSPEKFLQFNNHLFLNEYDMTKEKMQALVTGLGIDYSKLEEEMDADKIKDEIKRVHEFAGEAKINGVPAIFIGDEAYHGVIQLEKIEELLSKSSNNSLPDAVEKK